MILGQYTELVTLNADVSHYEGIVFPYEESECQCQLMEFPAIIWSKHPMSTNTPAVFQECMKAPVLSQPGERNPAVNHLCYQVMSWQPLHATLQLHIIYDTCMFNFQ